MRHEPRKKALWDSKSPAIQPEGSQTPHGAPYSDFSPAEVSPPLPCRVCAQKHAEMRKAQETLRSERKRAASVEAILVRSNAQLERQIEDLRELIFQGITLKPSETLTIDKEKTK